MKSVSMWGSIDDTTAGSGWGFSIPALPAMPDILSPSSAPSLSLFSDPIVKPAAKPTAEKAAVASRTALELKNELDSLMALQATLADDADDVTDDVDDDDVDDDAPAKGRELDHTRKPDDSKGRGASAVVPSSSKAFHQPASFVTSRPAPPRETAAGAYKEVVEESLYATDGEKARRDQLKGRKAMASLGQKAREEFAARQERNSRAMGGVSVERSASANKQSQSQLSSSSRLLASPMSHSMAKSLNTSQANGNPSQRSAIGSPAASAASAMKSGPPLGQPTSRTAGPRSPSEGQGQGQGQGLGFGSASLTAQHKSSAAGGQPSGRVTVAGSAAPEAADGSDSEYDGGGDVGGDDTEGGERDESTAQLALGSARDDGDGERIQVVVRVRPGKAQGKPLTGDGDELGRCVEVSEEDTTSLFLLARPNAIPFKFDYVAGETSTQEEIFARVGRPLAEAVINGYNATCFAYGQTGSGKTHTMFGKATQPAPRSGLSRSHATIRGGSFRGDGDVAMEEEIDGRGLVPRCLDFIFTYFQQRQKLAEQGGILSGPGKAAKGLADLGGGAGFMCTAHFLEVYQEQVHDLLDPMCPIKKVREDLERGVYVDGAMEEDIFSASEAAELLARGEAHRHVASTAMNHVSSRSHAIFSLKITTVVNDSSSGEDGGTKTLCARFNLVDLAGSERQGETKAAGERLKEASGINKSLTNLGLVIQALVDRAQGKQRHVHYRDSKITFLLRDSLGGNSKTTMLCAVSPSEINFGETLSSLRFAQRAKEIPIHAQVNEDYTLADVKALKNQLNALRAENADLKNRLRAALSEGHGNAEHGNKTPMTGRPMGRAGRASFDAESLRQPPSQQAPSQRKPLESRWLRASTDVESLVAEGGTANLAQDSEKVERMTAVAAASDSRRAGRKLEDSTLAPAMADALIDRGSMERQGSVDRGVAGASGGAGPMGKKSFKETEDKSKEKSAIEDLMRRLEVHEASTASQEALDALNGPNGRFNTKLSPAAAAASAAEREACLLNDLRQAMDLARAAAATKEMKEGEMSRHSMKLEGLVTRLEVEKTDLENECDAFEASVNALKAEVEGLTAQLAFAEGKQREAEAQAAEVRRYKVQASMGIDPAAPLKQKLEALQKDLAKSQRSAKAASEVAMKAKLEAEIRAQEASGLVAALDRANEEIARLRRGNPTPLHGSVSPPSVAPEPSSTSLPRPVLAARVSLARDPKSHALSRQSVDLAAPWTPTSESTPSSTPTARNPLNRAERPASTPKGQPVALPTSSSSFAGALTATPSFKKRPPALPLPLPPRPKAALTDTSYEAAVTTADAKGAATSKTSQVVAREKAKAREREDRQAAADAMRQAEARTGARLDEAEIQALAGGFFGPIGSSGDQSSGGLGEAVLASRREAAKGVREKGLTAEGSEASLSQTLATKRMEAVLDALHAHWPAPLDEAYRGGHGHPAPSSRGARLNALTDVVAFLKRFETRTERGHGLLAFIAALHRAGGCAAVAVVFAEVGTSPGGSYWDDCGLKLDKEVGLRASDHCRVGVAAAKASLLCGRLKPANGLLGEVLEASEVKTGLSALAKEAARCVAETRLRRDSPQVLFGESGSDMRTAAADDMLLAVATEGTSLMEAAVQSIGNQLRQLDSGESF